MTLTQSISHLESLLDANRKNFEPIRDFSARNRYRKYSRPVGRLDMLFEDSYGRYGDYGERWTGTCTASIISDKYILTNYHCIPGDEPGATVVQAELRMGYLSLSDTGNTYPVQVSPVERSKSLDYAILKVSGNPSRQYGKVQLVLRDPDPSEELFIIHHPAGKPKRVTRRLCRATSRRTVAGTDMHHRCDTLRGSSGSPIFSDNDMALVGLHYHGGLSSDTGSYNLAKRMTKIRRQSSIIQGILTGSFRDSLPDGGYGPEMVVIPAGSFQMGDIQGRGYSNEKPVHRVSVKSFAMGKYEVTFAEYDQFAEETGRGKPDDKGWGRGNRPVINVSWDDATDYAEWLSQQTGHTYHLPTEAQWEYAARAGTTTKYWWGNTASHEYANYGKDNCCGGLAIGAKDRWKYTAPVGSFSPNPFGLYDTVGNVYEWTCSEYEAKYTDKESKCFFGQKSGKHRVSRGGAWSSIPKYMRAAFRFRNSRDNRNNSVGVRLARRYP